MPGRSVLRTRGLGVLIGLVAILTGAGAVGNGAQASPPANTAAPTAGASSTSPDLAVDAPSGKAPTRPQSSLRPVVVAGDPPVITGETRYGEELTFAKPAWRPSNVKLAYQWLRDGAPIPGATGRRHRLVAGDIGHSLSVRITGSRSGFTSTVQESAAVGPVLGSRLTAANPWLYGTAQVGKTLAAGVRPWGPGSVSLAWQWYRDGEKIAGATATSYALAADDAGHTIAVGVSGSAHRFETTTRFSEPTAAVRPGVLHPTPVPLYSGVARVGETLTALPRQWGPGTVTLTYQWYRSSATGDVRIAGATRAKYTLVDADAGARLKVRVTGSEPGFTTVRISSAWTSTIRPAARTTDSSTTHG